MYIKRKLNIGTKIKHKTFLITEQLRYIFQEEDLLLNYFKGTE